MRKHESPTKPEVYALPSEENRAIRPQLTSIENLVKIGRVFFRYTSGQTDIQIVDRNIWHPYYGRGNQSNSTR